MNSNMRRLLIKVGTVDFCLYPDSLLEICTQVGGLVDYTQVDESLSVVGAFSFRRTQIPVVDLAGRLGIEVARPDVLLVFDSAEGNWALQVDHVEGFCFEEEMVDLPLPYLLKTEGWSCFDMVSLYRDKPFLRLELSACYGQI